MKIEDCEVGMKVRYKEKNSCSFDKGEELIIKECYKSNEVEFEDGRYTHPDYIEPVNKFEVGDEAIYQLVKGGGHKVEIFGCTTKNGKYVYAIKGQFKNVNEKFVLIAKEKELLQLKKKDQLEVGDKFRNKFYEFRIIFVAYDDFYNKKKYICKINDTGSKGLIQTMFPEDIKEIIYE
jgi:hypothetical protein